MHDFIAMWRQHVLANKCFMAIFMIWYLFYVSYRDPPNCLVWYLVESNLQHLNIQLEHTLMHMCTMSVYTQTLPP